MRASNRPTATRRACRHVWVLVILLLHGVPAQRSVVAQSSRSPRVVAIGDVHGDFDAFRGILEHTGVIDAAGRWVAGNTTLVQTGDLTDRGSKVRAVLDFLIDLEGQAAAAGDRVIVLLGNHETLSMIGDGRDVTPAIYATFADEQSEQRREAAYGAYVKWCAARAAELPSSARIYQPVSKGDWMAAHPPGFIEYREAFGPQGRYGRWLRTKPVLVRLGDTVFLHGGLQPDRAPRKLEDLNKQALTEIKRFDAYRSLMVDRKMILPFFTLDEMLAAAQAEIEADRVRARITAGETAGPGERRIFDTLDPLRLSGLLRLGTWAVIDDNGPLWFRGFATWSAAEGASHMAKLLQRHSVAHFVVGHSILGTRRITPRFSAAVFLIDTGMLSSFYPGGVASAIEIRDGRFTAIYANERTTLFEPGERATPSPR